MRSLTRTQAQAMADADPRTAKELKQEWKKILRPKLRGMVNSMIIENLKIQKVINEGLRTAVEQEWGVAEMKNNIIKLKMNKYNIRFLSHVYNKNKAGAEKWQKKTLGYIKEVLSGPAQHPESIQYFKDIVMGMKGYIEGLEVVLDADVTRKREKEQAAKKAKKAKKGRK